jgi:hypothetical protein
MNRIEKHYEAIRLLEQMDLFESLIEMNKHHIDSLRRRGIPPMDKYPRRIRFHKALIEQLHTYYIQIIEEL